MVHEEEVENIESDNEVECSEESEGENSSREDLAEDEEVESSILEFQ